MQVNDAKRSVLLVGLNGGEVSVISADGEIIATEGVTAGRHKCSSWVPFMSNEGDELSFSGDVVPMVPNGGRVRPMAYGPGQFESGANPDFVVTSADRMARELDHKIRGLDQTAKKVEARIAQLNNLAERAKTPVEVAKEEKVDVIDDDDVSDVRSSGDDSDDTGPDFGAEKVGAE